MSYVLFHGSDTLFDEEDMLESQSGGYVQKKWDSLLEKIFEENRPEDYVSRNDAVFLAESPDDIDALGGLTDYIYSVDIEEDPIKCDLAWYSEAESHIENDDLEKAHACAKSYWNSTPHPKHSCFEYLVNVAWIVEEVE